MQIRWIFMRWKKPREENLNKSWFTKHQDAHIPLSFFVNDIKSCLWVMSREMERVRNWNESWHATIMKNIIYLFIFYVMHTSPPLAKHHTHTHTTLSTMFLSDREQIDCNVTECRMDYIFHFHLLLCRQCTQAWMNQSWCGWMSHARQPSRNSHLTAWQCYFHLLNEKESRNNKKWELGLGMSVRTEEGLNLQSFSNEIQCLFHLNELGLWPKNKRKIWKNASKLSSMSNWK